MRRASVILLTALVGLILFTREAKSYGENLLIQDSPAAERIAAGGDGFTGNYMLAQADDVDTLLDNPLAKRRHFRGWGTPPEKKFLLALHASYIQPAGDFTKVAGPGVALIFGGSYRGLLFRNLVLGAETGVLCISPSVDNIKLHMLVPLYLTAGYDIELPWNLWISPVLGLGYSCNVIFFKEYDASSDSIKTKTDTAFEPILMGGAALSYRGFGSLVLFTEARYYCVLEKDGPIHILAFNAGAGIRF